MEADQLYKENDASSTTVSRFGVFGGPPVDVQPEAQRTIPVPEFISPESVPYSNRLFLILKTTLNAASSVQRFFPTNAIFGSVVLKPTFQNYAYYSWKKLVLRYTFSAPKSIAGGAIAGWMPYSNALKGTTDGQNASITTFVNGPWFKQLACMRPDTELVSLGSSTDIEIHIPWSYAFSKLPCVYPFEFLDTTAMEVGEPFAFLLPFAYKNLSNFPQDTQVQVYGRVEGLQFYGPIFRDISMDDMVPQMDIVGGKLRDVATSAIEKSFTKMVNTGINVVEQKVCDMTGVCVDANGDGNGPTNPEISLPNADPQPETVGGAPVSTESVKLDYYGDTTGIYIPHGLRLNPTLGNPRLHMQGNMTLPIMQFLSRPQLFGISEFSTSPVTLRGFGGSIPGIELQGMDVSWFAYFANLARYWRGSLRFHYVVMGHPLVQCEIASYYSANAETPLPQFESNPGKIVSFSGTKTFVFDMPFAHIMDFVPTTTSRSTLTEQTKGTFGMVEVRLRTTSSAFDIAPIIPVAVFISAGPDFQYFDPRPPGYYGAIVVPQPASRSYDAPRNRGSHPPKKVDIFEGMTPQIRLPAELEMLIELPEANYAVPLDEFVPISDLLGMARMFSRKMHSVEESAIYPADWTYISTLSYASSSWPNNDAFSHMDYVSYISELFLYWKGSMSFKVIANKEVGPYPDRLGLSVCLGEPFNTIESYSPIASTTQLGPSEATNFGGGYAGTNIELQPILEFTVPLRSSCPLGFTHYVDAETEVPFSIRTAFTPPPFIKTNIEYWVSTPVLSEGDHIYRMAGRDFALFTEFTIPPPYVWQTRGIDSAL